MLYRIINPTISIVGLIIKTTKATEIIVKQFYRIHVRLLGLPRIAKRLLMLGLDVMVLPMLVILSFMIRLDKPFHIPLDWWLPLAAPLVTIPVLYVARFYQVVIRYLGSEMAVSIMVGMSFASMALAALAYMVPAEATPRSVFIIYWLLGVLYLAGSRYLARRYLFWASGGHFNRKPVVIYGAGSAGTQAAASLASSGGYIPLAFVDDDRARQGELLQGLPVIGREGLEKLAINREIHAVLLAMPSANRARRMDVVRFLESLQLPVKSIPALADIISGRASIEEIRDVAIEDLLGRDPVPPRQVLLEAAIAAKVVMVTGAGGSIGGELCRQIMLLAPQRLIVLDVSELALYQIDRELADRCAASGIDFRAVLGSVTDRLLIERILSEECIDTLYHAAAYKHVPIVEQNPCVGVANNVLGTRIMAEAAEHYGVGRFILVSSDKAVRPANVMGASKRLAEMILQARAAMQESSTIFTMVRFGNVLGSSGSVVPLFRQQILDGGPVTVTHPEMTRYLMTIPEAARLVIQAGAMATGGEVFVLDMGEPIRIYDLASTMIHLMGYSVKDSKQPEGEIAIQVTGMRPGEKLYEELLIGEDSTPTDHPAVMRAHEEMLPWPLLEAIFTELSQALEARDDTWLREILRRTISGYQSADA